MQIIQNYKIYVSYYRKWELNFLNIKLNKNLLTVIRNIKKIQTAGLSGKHCTLHTGHFSFGNLKTVSIINLTDGSKLGVTWKRSCFLVFLKGGSTHCLAISKNWPDKYKLNTSGKLAEYSSILQWII